MSVPNVPNWIRIILVIASVLSFAPQLNRTISRRNSTGISTRYVLLNLISTTEQFALTFYFIVNHFDAPDFFVRSPKNAGDWINLVQMSVVLILWLTFFVVCLYLPSEHRDCSVKVAVGIYVAFLLISVVPVFADAIKPGSHEERQWTLALFFGIHSLFLSWIITALNVAAIYYQVRETLSQPQNTALSRVGLATQAIIFGILAISWIGRVRFPFEGFAERFWGLLSTWYELVGWAAVDTGVFALGQAFILWKVSRQAVLGSGAFHGETEPLLHA
ncbi:hypothetical protein BKA66DRAFT_571239 [Pyrenochaeta sp. MPI-SDFR-AT-0127]|nr:hypothetical protein BKA66DRAFT_571239 [Pyrenochaeta sp. MPI-SDFR-AT-0127]